MRVAAICRNDAKSAEKSRRSGTVRDAGLDRPAVFGGGSNGRWKNLQLKISGGGNPRRRDGMRSTPYGATQNQVDPFSEKVGTTSGSHGTES